MPSDPISLHHRITQGLAVVKILSIISCQVQESGLNAPLVRLTVGGGFFGSL